ncbi:hypothetical protein B0I35DRAFT_429229 [Stachybotrys elegans]|uniref:Protein kinase domain-containing protein n=1 Tax=Stachybotrys elegans TaxID=80388 RepID=A0A8K0WT07_9HYPO|nr:hypothetical protein B0I35DRAFT_429229 [Stachybotrys elegans]
MARPYKIEWKKELRHVIPPVDPDFIANHTFPRWQQWDGFDMRFIKTVGAGGFGTVTLWEVKFEDCSTRQIVMKTGAQFPNHGSEESFNQQDERLWLARYAGAANITQLAPVQHIAYAIRHRMNSPHTIIHGPTFSETSYNALCMEYAQFGNLYEVVSKIYSVYPDQLIPDRIAWEIWESFVTAVAAIAYQPFHRALPDPEDFDEGLRGAWQLDEKDFQEWVELMEEVASTHDAHFDMDERNTLVARNPHGEGLILKLHDFCSMYSHQMLDNWKAWSEKEYWTARSFGKINRFPPEQVHKDWDSFEPCQENATNKFKRTDFTQGSQVAGRYGLWSDIFVIAKMTESILTGDHTTHPFQPKDFPYMRSQKLKKMGEPDDPPAPDGITTNPPMETKMNAPTYGWRIGARNGNQKFKRFKTGYEDELVETLVKCQFELPQLRPTISTLLVQLHRRKRRGWEGIYATQEAVEKWWEPVLGVRPSSLASEPPAPAANTGAAGGAEGPTTAAAPPQVEESTPSVEGDENEPPTTDRHTPSSQSPARRVATFSPPFPPRRVSPSPAKYSDSLPPHDSPGDGFVIFDSGGREPEARQQDGSHSSGRGQDENGPPPRARRPLQPIQPLHVQSPTPRPPSTPQFVAYGAGPGTPYPRSVRHPQPDSPDYEIDSPAPRQPQDDISPSEFAHAYDLSNIARGRGSGSGSGSGGRSKRRRTGDDESASSSSTTSKRRALSDRSPQNLDKSDPEIPEDERAFYQHPVMQEHERRRSQSEDHDEDN